MKIRRMTAFVVSLAMLQFSIGSADACVHEQSTATPPVEQGSAHHGEHGQPVDAPAPDCEAPAGTDCCVAVASCMVVLAGPDAIDVVVALSTHVIVAAPPAARLFSVVTAPEPPPPKA